MSSTFFINGHGMPLAKLQNSKGSLLQRIGITCGVPDLNPTMLRQAAERWIQANPEMKNKAQVLNSHSEDVGREIYDKSNARVRAEFINYMKSKEGGESTKKTPTNFDLIMREQMKEAEIADAAIRRKRAQEFLENEM